MSCQALYPRVAVVVCSPFDPAASPEGVEDPHTHPEPPSDRILTDFFCANHPRVR